MAQGPDRDPPGRGGARAWKGRWIACWIPLRGTGFRRSIVIHVPLIRWGESLLRPRCLAAYAAEPLLNLETVATEGASVDPDLGTYD